MLRKAKNPRARRRLAKFHKQDGKCFWCQTKMVIIYKAGGRLPHNACTLDHLNPSYSIDRIHTTDNKPRSVAACWKCNNERAKLKL